MKATQIFRDDHKKLRGLVRQCQTARLRAPEMREGVVRELLSEARIDIDLKENFLYGRLQAADSDGDVLVAQASNNRSNIRRLLEEFERVQGQADGGLPLRDPEFEPKLAELLDSLEQSFSDEEQEIFSRAEKVLGPELDKLGELVESEKKRLAQAEPYQARPEVVQDPRGGEQKRKRRGKTAA